MRATRCGEIQDRFWQRVDKSDPDGCWNWTGTKIKDGYGVIAGPLNGKRYMPKGRNMLAHRVSWIIEHGDIPESHEYHGWVVMHKCDNPSCVNPAHLTLGTQKANVGDMIAKKRDVRVHISGTQSKRAKLTDEQVTEIRSSPIGGAKLSRKFGVNINTIARARYGQSYAVGDEAERLKAMPKVRTGLKGGENPYAKLTDDLVRQIRESELSAEVWGKRLNIGGEAVRAARCGRTFQHIPMPQAHCPEWVDLDWLRERANASDALVENKLTVEKIDKWLASGDLVPDGSNQVQRDEVIRMMRKRVMKIPRYLKK